MDKTEEPVVLNEALIRETMAYIRLHQREWDQRVFAADTAGWKQPECGTVHCFAGWALRLSGFGLTRTRNFIAPEGFDVPEDARVGLLAQGGTLVHADEMARILLGLDGDQMYALFYETAAVVDVEEFAARLSEITGLEGL